MSKATPNLITDGLPRGHGYIEIDHRNAPIPDSDLPPGVRRYFEADTYTCSHCDAVVFLDLARTRERYKCKKCGKHICDPCAADMAVGVQCKTMQQQVEEYFAQLKRSIGP